MARGSQLIKVVLIFISLNMISCSGKETITDKDVKALYELTEKAINEKDAKTVLAGISDNVVINMKMLSPEGNQEMSMGKDEYAKNIRETFSVAQDYKYRVDNMDINISADGKTAIVNLKAYEELTVQGQNIKAVSKGENELKMVNGRLQVVRIDGVVIMQQ